MKIKNILCILCLWISIVGYGQSGKVFTTDGELSNSLINKLYQDRNGFIWIATENGLNRYDGAKVTIYKHDPNDPHSLSHNYVRTLFEDAKGRLFVGTCNGLQIYDAARDSFTLPARRENGEVFNSNISALLQRKNGDIWVSGNELCQLFIEDDELIVKPLLLDIPTSMTGAVIETTTGEIWMTAGENGIYRLTPAGKGKQYLIQKKGTPIIDVCEDYKGNIYAISMGNGLFRYDRTHDSFIPIPYKGQYNLFIKTIYQSSQDILYLGTDGEGVKVYNSRTNEITDAQFSNSCFDVTNAKVHSLLKDYAGNFWLAIYQKGVVMIPTVQNGFKYIGSKDVNSNIIGSYCVTSLLRDHNNDLWVSTDNDGIYVITPELEQKEHFVHENTSSSVPAIIITLYEDSEHNFWFGSFTNGMGKIDRNTGRCTYLDNLVDANGKHVQRVYAFAEDNRKRLWIATMGAGLLCHDLKSGKTEQVTPPDSYLWLSSVLYSKDNKLYIGGYDGLICVDLNTSPFNISYISPKVIVHCLHQDKEGVIWAGTSEGIYNYSPQTDKLTLYTAQDGLPSDVVYAVQEDNQGFLWISTDAGISQFNKHNHKFINYYVSDGLQGNEFSKNASFKDADGTLWFGGVNGVTYFNPQEITDPAKKWNIRITDFYIHNTPVRKGMKSGRYEIIDRPVFEAQKFHLAHKDNAFSIEFATMELNSPERLIYMYSMNYSDWVVLRNDINRISFNDLPPGTYNLRVRAGDHNMLSNIKEITILISPAWYASNWAKLCYVILLALAIYLILMQIRNRYQIRQQMIEHARAEEINEAKLQFFINISHEIRTPMSLIISPLQKLMMTDSDADRQRSYSIMFRNSKRILDLVNQLMDIRKIDKGQMLLKFQEIEIVEFIRDLQSTFEYQVNAKHISLNFHVQQERLNVWVDPKNFDKIILNLLSNAFKFTPEQGQIDIYLRTGEDMEAPVPLQHYFEFVVADTGIGIDESEMNQIFERFYQIRNHLNNSNIGTGIGLHLVHSLVKLHHGTIRVENNEKGKGSRFIVRLPLGNKHLNSKEIDENEKSALSPSKEVLILSDTISTDEEVKLKSKSKYKVLIVDDDEEIRKYICRELASDFHMMESTNGREALSIVLRQTPDLVISDIMMQEMDGLTLCHKIKQNVNINHIPVILLTAKTREEDNMEGLDMGADAYIIKPFNIDILRKTVINIVKGREMLRNCFGGSQKQEVKNQMVDMQSTDNKLLDKVMNIINRNISNPELTVEMIAKEIGISRVHLHRKLKELTNQSTRDLIRNVRLKQAANLLIYKRYSVTEVASLTGFSSITLFSRSFKELYGMTPSEYIGKHSNEVGEHREL